MVRSTFLLKYIYRMDNVTILKDIIIKYWNGVLRASILQQFFITVYEIGTCEKSLMFIFLNVENSRTQ